MLCTSMQEEEVGMYSFTSDQFKSWHGSAPAFFTNAKIFVYFVQT